MKKVICSLTLVLGLTTASFSKEDPPCTWLSFYCGNTMAYESYCVNVGGNGIFCSCGTIVDCGFHN